MFYSQIKRNLRRNLMYVVVSLKTSGKDVVVREAASAEMVNTTETPYCLVCSDPSGKTVAQFRGQEVAGWRLENEDRVPSVA
jgi:hypothetical protein